MLETRRNYFFYAISLFLDLFIGIIITGAVLIWPRALAPLRLVVDRFAA